MTLNNEFKYEQSTLSKFDIIGSYFVNLFYNEFYSKANSLKISGSYNNTTDAYKNILCSYLDFIKKPEFFKQIIKGIHAYCISTTKYTTMTHKECIDFMVSEFIPQKLWNSIRENQKNKLFHESINHSINLFTTEIISNHLVMIIDNHSHHENITILQDLFLKIILLEKDKIYSKFLNPESNNTISVELFKSKLMEIITEKKELVSVNIQLKKNVEILKQLMEKNSNIITELQNKNKLSLSTIVDLKKQLDHSNKQNEDLQILLNKKNTFIREEIKPTTTKSIIDNNKKFQTKQPIESTVKITKPATLKKKDKYSKLLSDSDNSDSEFSSESDNELDDNSNNKEVVTNKSDIIDNMFTDCSSNSIINIIKKNKESELEFDNNDDYY